MLRQGQLRSGFEEAWRILDWLKHGLCGVFAIWLWSYSLPVSSQPVPRFDYTPDFEERAWEEQQAQLPAYPRQENLARIDLGAAASFDFFVDTESIGIGKDGVVRYTLVAKSPSGALNVSFEGIRCVTRERKLYGFGHPDGAWSKARNSDWIPITRMQVNIQHVALADYYFCPKRQIVRSIPEAISALRRGGHPER